MNKKKIAIIVPSLSVGGAENMVAQLSVHLNKDNFELLLVVLGSKLDNPIQNYLENYEVQVVYLNKKLGINYKIIIDLYRLLTNFSPNIVHTHLHAFAYIFPWVIVHNVKMLHTVHNVPQFELSKKGKKLISILYRLNKAIPIAISNTIEVKMKEYYRLNKIETIYNPVDIKRYQFRREYDTEKAITFISIGRLTPQKNQELLLNSFAIIKRDFPDVKLKIVGDGELRNKLMNLANKLDIDRSVEFLGNIKGIEIELSKADVFVLSSDYEGLPLTVLEAMASGLPIISTKVGGVPDIVTDNGILVEARNKEQLAEAMFKMVRERGFLKDYGEKSFNNVQQYDILNITKEYERLYLKYAK